ncbi:MAG: S8 family serine peptidase [Bacteroidetes bacterium]|nr:S8 family serine peptidase [Bacteroidota bacterium]
MKTNYAFLLFCVAIELSLINISFAQTETNVEELKEIAKEEGEKWKINRRIAEEYAIKNDFPIRQVNENHTIEIISIDSYGMPVYYITDNLDAATTTRASKLWSGGGLGLSYSGSGYSKLGEWDGGAVLTTHTEFGSRVTQKDAATGSNYHATHVAGTMVSAGSNDANSKGAAYAANLDAYDWSSDASEMATAAAAGMELSNHSYGFITGCYYNSGDSPPWTWYGNTSISATEDTDFGFYNSSSQSWDNIAYNAPYYLIIKSAGNDRGDGPDPSTNHTYYNGSTWTTGTDTRDVDGGTTGYDCIGNKGVAKNLLTVGAVYEVLDYNHPDDVIMSSFSGWGPADDGRIKPDIVAKGVNVYSTYNTSTTSYALLQGTSMSSPNTTGTLVILQEHYQSTHSSAVMRSATLKALVCHTADEAGDDIGPDYKFGWGLLNAEEAANLITIDANYQNVIDEQTLTNAGTYTRNVTASGNEPLKVTVCWTDPAGTPVSASLDPSDAMLVNDLDLRITYSSTTYYPWQLDKDNPADAATNSSENDVDNIEQVYIANPTSGSYTITVDHDGTLGSSQAFSIIISGIDDNSTTPASCVSDMVFPANSATGVSASITLEWEKVLDASSYDLYFGTDGSGSSTPTNIVNGANQSLNTYAPSGLSSATTYYVQVIPRNKNGIKSGCSTIWSFTTATFTSNSTFPHSQNFDAFSSIGSGWEDETNDDFDWSVRTGSTPSGSTGPSEDHTSGSGKYLYTEASSPNDIDKRANLLSPVYNWSALSQPVLEFWYHMYGVNLGTTLSWFFVDIYSGGEWHYSVWSKNGQQSSNGTDWKTATIDLSDYKSGTIHRLRFRVVTQNWSSDFAIDDIYISDGNENTWVGNSTSWESTSNWSRSYVPQDATNVEIPTSPSGGSNFPLISSNASCYDLTINSSASVNIDPGYSLSVNGSLTNSAGNSGLVLNSDATGTASIIHSTSSINGTVERYITGNSSNEPYHFISSPIKDLAFSSIWTSGDYNVYWYDESNTSGIDQGWTRILSGNLSNGRGYSIVSNYSNRTLSMAGSLMVPSDISSQAAVTYTSSATSDNDGWNLIGNPYPCALNTTEFLSDNSSLLETGYAAVYFYDNPDGDRLRGDYATRNSSGGTQGGSATTPDATIALGQAFFVKVKSSTSNISFASDQRTANSGTQFFTPEMNDKQHSWLSVNGPDSSYNETLISFLPDANSHFDPGYDAIKLRGNPYIALYTFIEGIDHQYVIQALPSADLESEIPVKVPIGLFAGKSGLYSFSIARTENLNSNIYMEDLERAVVKKIDSLSHYEVELTKGEYNDRFVLHYNYSANSVESRLHSGLDFTIYTSDNKLVIKSLTKLSEAKVKIFTLKGKEVKSIDIPANETIVTDLNELSKALYMYTLLSDNQYFSGKIIIK